MNHTDRNIDDDGTNRRTFLAGTGMVVTGGALGSYAPRGNQLVSPGSVHLGGETVQQEGFSATLNIEVTAEETLDEVEVLGIEWQISVPFDHRQGTFTGERQHAPLVVTKPLHHDTPRLYSVLSNGEVLQAVTVSIYDDADGGSRRRPVYELTLENGRIASIQAQSIGLVETVAFVYENVTVAHADGGSHTDSWAEHR